MRETDISKFTGKNHQQNSENRVKNIFRTIGRICFTLMMVLMCAGIVVAGCLGVYIGGIAAEPTGINLKAKGLNQTSFVYVKNEKGKFVKYQSLYSTENREWVAFNLIPKHMGDAVIAIEDKDFRSHHGVDWTRTIGAMLNLASGEATYGGSTITQQLIKNITDDNEVSLNRKIREIVKALKLETEYTKDEILEAYLNVVNFGSNCQGVQAASTLYFGKDIEKCSIAECAAIAGITQNPSKWNPLVYPDNNRQRRELVLSEMHRQGKITKEQYDQAMKESAKMKFVGYQEDSNKNMNVSVQNWYQDELMTDLREDLATYYNISPDAAADKIYTEGLKIYSCMDVKTQEYLEQAAKNINKAYDPGLQAAASLIAPDGRVIATCGSSEEKTANLLFNRATQSVLQPGSTIKPVIVYPYAIETGELYYSSVVKDEPIDNYQYKDGRLVPGPDNWYLHYKGNMLLPDALEISANAPVVQTMMTIGTENAYNQAVTLQGFSHLDVEDKSNAGGLSIGGLRGGVTVREMAAASAYMGNGGLYYKPYTYYYVTDAEDNIIIDNRDAIPKQCYSPETAYIMNRLLHYNMTYCRSTNAHYGRIEGWDIIGKTGTTDDDKDSWFVGTSPYATLAVWTGFDQPKTITGTGQRNATTLFQDVMSFYLEGKEKKEYTVPASIVAADYDPSTGLTYNVGDPSSDKYVGYYKDGEMPKQTLYVHYGDGAVKETEESTSEDETSATEETKRKKKKPTKPTETIDETEVDNTKATKPTKPAETEPSDEETEENDE